MKRRKNLGLVVREVRITAIQRRGVLHFIDGKGRRFGRVAAWRIEHECNPDEFLKRMVWRTWAATECVRTYANWKERNRDTLPWVRWAKNMVTSNRIRHERRPAICGRRMFDQYKTNSWPGAAKRLVMQGINRHRVRTRSGWERWAYTVTNNAQKRTIAREQRRKCKADPRNPEGPELPVRDQRATTNARNSVFGSSNPACRGRTAQH